MSSILSSTTETLSTRKIWSNECLDLTNQISHLSSIKRIKFRMSRGVSVARCSPLYDISWKHKAKREDFPQYWQLSGV